MQIHNNKAGGNMFKIDWNKKYTTIAAYVVIVIFICAFGAIVLANAISSGIVGRILSGAFALLSPLVYAFGIAYLINPLMKVVEKYLFAFVEKKKNHRKLRRALAVGTTYFALLLVLSGFIVLMIPQISASYNELTSKLSGYIESAQSWADKFVQNIPFIGEGFANFDDFLEQTNLSETLKNFISGSGSFMQSAGSFIVSFAESFVIEMKNAFFGLVLSIYFLFSKEILIAQVKKILSAFFSPKHVQSMIRGARYTNRTFGSFLTGKILEAIMVGLVTFIALGLFDIPFYPVISIVIAVTDIIPIFGPFLGAIPSAIIIFIANPIKALWFAIIILIIQQIDGNIIGPKILGEKTGLSSMWVIISLMVAGGLFGFAGMVLGVPFFAVIYMWIKLIIEGRLKKKDLPVSTIEYLGDGYPIKHDDTASEKTNTSTSDNAEEK